MRVEVAPFHVGVDVTDVTVATTVVMLSETPLIWASHWPLVLVVHEAVPRLLPFVRRKVTVTVALATAAFVEVFRTVTVSAGRHPPPDVSDVSEVELTKLLGAAVVVVVGGTVVVVVGGAVVVVVGGAVVVVVVGAAVVVVVGATVVVVDDAPGMDVPVGADPSMLGSAPMRVLVVS